jgi:glucose-1-phosphate cytidylyltransferase
MLPLGGTPVIVHIIKNFIRQGFREFILAAGYRKSVLDDYFDGKNFGAKIEIVDTGEDADTGTRVRACRDRLDGEPFVVTYGDGLCDVPLTALVDFHRRHSGLVTITSMPMASQYGVLWVDENGQVERFAEKPLIEHHWINVGFMVFNPEALDHFSGDSLETQIVPDLIKQGQVYSYRHTGFFKSVDSYKDVVEFEEFFNTDADNVPWIARRPRT